MAEPLRPRGVKIYSWPPGNGYGDAAAAYMKALDRKGIPVTWTPLVPGVAWAGKGLGFEPYTGTSWPDPDLAPFCNRPIPYALVVAHIVPEYYPALREAEPGKPLVGYTVWETDRLPRHWPPLLNAVDRLLVPCRWNVEVFEEGGVTKPVGVVPHILPHFGEAKNEGDLAEMPGLEPDDFLFYTIGTWTRRKAIWNTVAAFRRAFAPGEKAALLLKTTERDLVRINRPLDVAAQAAILGLHVIHRKSWVLPLQGWLDKFRPRTATTLARLAPDGGPRILLRTGDWPRERIEELHRRGDCFVSLCHAEGWGLGAFEAAGLDRPVLITGYGGQLDFLPPELAYLVDYRMAPVDDPASGGSYTPDQNWAEPDVDHAARLMREVYENREDARRRGARLGEHVRERFHEEAVVQVLLAQLQELMP